MDLSRFDSFASTLTCGISRRAALRGLGGGGLAAGLLGAAGLQRRDAVAQGMTPVAAPAGWGSMHLEIEVTPMNPVTITHAGGGPRSAATSFTLTPRSSLPVTSTADRALPMLWGLDPRRQRRLGDRSTADHGSVSLRRWGDHGPHQ